MLTAYRITYSNGDVTETSMAANVTLAMAEAYFIGNQFELDENQPLVTAVKVEQIRGPQKSK